MIATPLTLAAATQTAGDRFTASAKLALMEMRSELVRAKQQVEDDCNAVLREVHAMEQWTKNRLEKLALDVVEMTAPAAPHGERPHTPEDFRRPIAEPVQKQMDLANGHRNGTGKSEDAARIEVPATVPTSGRSSGGFSIRRVEVTTPPAPTPKTETQRWADENGHEQQATHPEPLASVQWDAEQTAHLRERLATAECKSESLTQAETTAKVIERMPAIAEKLTERLLSDDIGN